MKARYFAVIAVVALAASIWQIGQHRQHVQTQLKVITAEDQAGSVSALDLATATGYVHDHMGTSTTLFLQAGYDRAQAASQATATNANGQVYADAQAACASHANSIVQADCVQAYLAAHSSSGANPTAPAPAPSKADYTKSFTAPAWTPDSAGIAFLVAVVALALTVYVALLGMVATEDGF